MGNLNTLIVNSVTSVTSFQINHTCVIFEKEIVMNRKWSTCHFKSLKQVTRFAIVFDAWGSYDPVVWAWEKIKIKRTRWMCGCWKLYWISLQRLRNTFKLFEFLRP